MECKTRDQVFWRLSTLWTQSGETLWRDPRLHTGSGRVRHGMELCTSEQRIMVSWSLSSCWGKKSWRELWKFGFEGGISLSPHKHFIVSAVGELLGFFFFFFRKIRDRVHSSWGRPSSAVHMRLLECYPLICVKIYLLFLILISTTTNAYIPLWDMMAFLIFGIPLLYFLYFCFLPRASSYLIFQTFLIYHVCNLSNLSLLRSLNAPQFIRDTLVPFTREQWILVDKGYKNRERAWTLAPLPICKEWFQSWPCRIWMHVQKHRILRNLSCFRPPRPVISPQDRAAPKPHSISPK